MYMIAIPPPFACMARYLLDDEGSASELWKRVLLAAKKNGLEKDESIILPAAVEALRILMGKMKSAEPARNPAAYFYVVIDRKLKMLV
jgi:hypothetical protein